MLVIWSSVWIDNKNFEAEFKAVQETVTLARDDGKTTLERVALTQKIVDINKELGRAKYWNGTVFDWYIPDSLAELDLIR